MPHLQASARATFHDDREDCIVRPDCKPFMIMEETPGNGARGTATVTATPAATSAVTEAATPPAANAAAPPAANAATPPAANAATSAPRRGPLLGVAAGATAMVCVGGSVAVSSLLAGAP